MVSPGTNVTALRESPDPTVRVRLNKLIDKIKLAEDKTDNDEFVELIKRYVIDEDIEFDVAKNLITEYKKIKEKSKNG